MSNSDVITGACGHAFTSELRWSEGANEYGEPVVGFWAGESFVGGREDVQDVVDNINLQCIACDPHLWAGTDPDDGP